MAAKKSPKAARPRDKGGTISLPPVTFDDGTKPGDVLDLNWEDDEDGVSRVVGRLVRTRIGGAIWQGKARNHKPGPGRPPNEIRIQAGDSFAKRIHVLEAIVDNPRSSPRDINSAMSLLAKVGVASQVEHKGDKGSPIIILPAQQQPMIVQGVPVHEDIQEAQVEALPGRLPAPNDEGPTPE